MVREYHKLPHGPPSPVLPQQKVRGPAGGGEEGSQCDDPTQQQVLTGGPAGWDPPSSPLLMWGRGFSKRSCLLLLWWHSSPGIATKSLVEASLYPRLLLLISVPSVIRATLVLGSSVREKPVKKWKVAKTLTTQSILIPGLEGSNQASSSVLYSSSLTSTTKRKISALSPNSLIFKPNPQKATISKISSSLSPSSIKVFKSTAPRSKNKKSNHVGYEGSLKLQRKLKSILLQASLKTGKTEKKIKKKNSVDPLKRNSISRKLAISEISCSKLSNKHIYSSPTILASFPSSKTNQLSSHPPSSVLTTSSRSSNFSSHSSSFQSNYSQIIAHLKAEWELAEDSEILNIKNTPARRSLIMLSLKFQWRSRVMLLLPLKLQSTPLLPQYRQRMGLLISLPLQLQILLWLERTLSAMKVISSLKETLSWTK